MKNRARLCCMVGLVEFRKTGLDIGFKEYWSFEAALSRRHDRIGDASATVAHQLYDSLICRLCGMPMDFLFVLTNEVNS